VNNVWRPSLSATTYPRLRGDWTIAHNDGTFSAFEPETGTVSTVVPELDAELPALADAVHQGELISYRIARRAIVATGHSYLKIVRPSRLPDLQQAHSFAASIPNLVVPTTIGYDPVGTLEMAALAGHSLHAHIRSQSLNADTIDAVAVALATLHGAPNNGSLPLRQPDQPERWLDTIARVDTAAAKELAAVGQQLPAIGRGTQSVIHGDLHDKNVYLKGQAAGFIDLDGLGRGDAEHDLANLGVHLQLRGIQTNQNLALASAHARRLYTSYLNHRGFDHQIVAAYEQHTWFRLGCLYLLRRRDTNITDAIFEQLTPTDCIAPAADTVNPSSAT